MVIMISQLLFPSRKSRSNLNVIGTDTNLQEKKTSKKVSQLQIKLRKFSLFLL